MPLMRYSYTSRHCAVKVYHRFYPYTQATYLQDLDYCRGGRYFSKVKLQMPVLALGGEHSFDTAALESMKLLATNVTCGIVPVSGA